MRVSDEAEAKCRIFLPPLLAESVLSLGILVVKDENALTHNTRDRMPLGAKGSFGLS